MVKTNTKGFCKETIDNLTKDLPGGYYLVLRSKPMVPRGRLYIAFGYKSNAHKVPYFIVIDSARSKLEGLPYLFKNPDQFTNVAICLVAQPLVMSTSIT